MRWWAFVVALAVLIPLPWAPPAQALVLVSGDITVDTVWTPAETYLIVNDTTVLPGVDLTVEAGTTVLFQTNHTSNDFPQLKLTVRGNLRVLGAPGLPVRFTSDHPDPTRGDWDSLRLVNTRDAVIEHAVIEYALIGLLLDNATARIANTSFLESSIAGLELFDARSEATVVDSLLSAKDVGATFIPNQRQGAIVFQGTATFRNSTFAENLVGLFSLEGSTVVLEDTVIENGWNGITAVGTDLTLRDSVIRNNGVEGFGGVGIKLSTGTRAVMRGNVIEDNGFGLSIEYGARASVGLSSNNTVNGIPLESIYYVGRSDEVVTGVVMDSGHSGVDPGHPSGYRGNASFEGHLTLYDSRNLLFDRVTLRENFQNLQAENSTFTFVNSSLSDTPLNFAQRFSGDVVLGQVSTGQFFNVDFNRTAVTVNDDVSRLWVGNFVRGQARTETGDPLGNVTVAAKVGPTDYDTDTTDPAGRTRWLRGVHGYHAKVPSQSLTAYTAVGAGIEARSSDVFLDNPRGLPLDVPRTEVFTRLDRTPPTAVAVFPPDRSLAVPVGSAVTLLFSEPMDPASVAAALAVDGETVTNLTWRDGNRSLSFEIVGMEAGTTYIVSLSNEARDVAGNRVTPVTFSFTTAARARGFELLPVALVAVTLLAVGLLIAAFSWSRRRDAAREQEGDPRRGGEEDGGEDADRDRGRRPDPVARDEVDGDEKDD